MPYDIIKNNNHYELRLKKDNKLLGTHKTKKDALKQIQAIEINKKLSGSGRTDEELWEKSKEIALKKFDNKHSARMIQYAQKIYKSLGGEYDGELTEAQKSMKKWTDEDWGTKSGLPSKITGERYLPKKIIEKLTDEEYNETTKSKQLGTLKGKQYVKQPKKIVEIIKKFYEGKGVNKDGYKTIKIGKHNYTYYISDKPNKKLMTIVNDKKIYFGDSKYQHFRDKTGLLPMELSHFDNARRNRYIKRATNIKDKNGNYTYLNPESPNFHAVHILW